MPEPAKRPPTFSESWHRIANQRIYLRPEVTIRRQNYRGERWFVIENPLNNQYFRLRPEAYEFVSRLDPHHTVDEVWKECLERSPDSAPGQEECIRLLSQLYFANLLHYGVASDSAQLFERFRKRRLKETRARLLNIMFMRFPVLDPDAFLKRTLPLVGRLISPFGAVLWLAVVGLGIKVVIDNFPALLGEGREVLAPGNLFLLYSGLVIAKVLHEFGHAYFCRKFGGEVHVMGVMLLIFTPLPYVDATSSWSFRSRWKRVLVGAAGMIVEVFVAAVAAMIWAGSGPGTLHSVAYNIIFVASVSTVLFNANPLLRFDGYYILSDLLEIPNLHQRAAQHLKHLFKRYVFGVKTSASISRSTKEKSILVCFGILSNIYRIFVFTGILLFVADRFLLLGAMMAVACLVGWVAAPIIKLVHYLLESPELDRARPRAIAATTSMVAGIFLFLQFVPFPARFTAAGVIESGEFRAVSTEAAGIIDEFLVEPGSLVEEGDVLIAMRNPELNASIALATGRVRELEARLRQARYVDPVAVEPIERQIESAENRLREFETDQDALRVLAKQRGIWVSPGIRNFRGVWIPQGAGLGLVADPDGFKFTAVVPQTDAARLFRRTIEKAEVRLAGEAGENMEVRKIEVVDGGSANLPSPILGSAAGGPIAVSAEDPSGRRAAEPFYVVKAWLTGGEPVTLRHGRTGRIRFTAGWEPLLPRWVRRLRQVLQKRYQL